MLDNTPHLKCCLCGAEYPNDLLAADNMTVCDSCETVKRGSPPIYIASGVVHALASEVSEESWATFERAGWAGDFWFAVVGAAGQECSMRLKASNKNPYKCLREDLPDAQIDVLIEGDTVGILRLSPKTSLREAIRQAHELLVSVTSKQAHVYLGWYEG